MKRNICLSSIQMGDKSKDLLVFLAGFPDDCLCGWGRLVEELSTHYYCICLCLPGYDGIDKMPSFGYDFKDIVLSMHETLSFLVPDRTFTLLIHDWGSVIGCLYQQTFPLSVTKMILFDVCTIGNNNVSSFKPKDILIISTYQTAFAICYIISQFLNYTIGNILFLTVFPILNILGIHPCPHDKLHRPISEVNVKMCYPYYYFLRSILIGMFFPSFKLLIAFPSNCPILYMFGTKKNCMFHSPNVLIKLENTPRCKWLAVEDAGHWFMRDKVEVVLPEVQRFLSHG